MCIPFYGGKARQVQRRGKGKRFESCRNGAWHHVFEDCTGGSKPGRRKYGGGNVCGMQHDIV